MKRLRLYILIVLIVGFAQVGVMFIMGRDLKEPDTAGLELDRLSVPDEMNAFTHFNNALQHLYLPTNGVSLRDIRVNSSEDESFASEIIRRNALMLSHLKRGLECNVCQEPVLTDAADFHSHISGWVDIMEALDLKCRLEQYIGRYDSAAETCTTLLRFGELVQEHAEGDMSFWAGVTSWAVACVRAQDLARESDIDGHELSGVLQAINALSPLEEGLIRATKIEYWGARMDIDDFIGEVGLPPIISWYSMQPNKMMDVLADDYRILIKNIPLVYGEIDLSGALRQGEYKPPKRLLHLPPPNREGHMLAYILAPYMGWVLEQRYERECLINATRVMLGCLIYEKAHGELPETLDTLVPEYFDTIPRDPFDGKPLRYDREKLIIYSVGVNLKDDGGSEKRRAELPPPVERERRRRRPQAGQNPRPHSPATDDIAKSKKNRTPNIEAEDVVFRLRKAEPDPVELP